MEVIWGSPFFAYKEVLVGNFNSKIIDSETFLKNNETNNVYCGVRKNVEFDFYSNDLLSFAFFTKETNQGDLKAELVSNRGSYSVLYYKNPVAFSVNLIIDGKKYESNIYELYESGYKKQKNLNNEIKIFNKSICLIEENGVITFKYNFKYNYDVNLQEKRTKEIIINGKRKSKFDVELVLFWERTKEDKYGKSELFYNSDSPKAFWEEI